MCEVPAPDSAGDNVDLPPGRNDLIRYAKRAIPPPGFSPSQSAASSRLRPRTTPVSQTAQPKVVTKCGQPARPVLRTLAFSHILSVLPTEPFLPSPGRPRSDSTAGLPTWSWAPSHQRPGKQHGCVSRGNYAPGPIPFSRPLFKRFGGNIPEESTNWTCFPHLHQLFSRLGSGLLPCPPQQPPLQSTT